MELDMYNDEHKIAVEYNGAHHYEYPNDYHTCIDDFNKQVQRDREKAVICVQQGVRLLIVRAQANIEDEISEALRQLN